MNATPANCVFPVTDFSDTKQNILNWLRGFRIFCFLDNQNYQFNPHAEEILVAAGCIQSVRGNAGNMLGKLQKQLDKEKNWWFGHLSYDLKNEVEHLHSDHPDPIGFPDLFFFQPEILLRLNQKKMEITAASPESVFLQIINSGSSRNKTKIPRAVIRKRMEKKEYIGIINQLKQHILRGDCYEINFCQEFYTENILIDPFAAYWTLTALSPNPFSVFYRVNDSYLVCASPERYIRKEGTSLLSQPIKGTAVRFSADTEKDLASKSALALSKKDKSENVMIVDLVRNDLSKVCKENTVRVDELFGIYSFPQVHQMISTISGEIKDGVDFSEIIRASFPMGSMTGAPKKKVMELIEKYEKTRRGIFSGSVGYIAPHGDFDFNVVIRSIMYNASSKYLSYQAGSAITFNSDPEKEYEECMLKAQAFIKLFGKK